MSFYRSTKKELDPLDREILERAFDVTWESIKQSHLHFDADSDKELEAEVRRELVEIARINGVSDPETLKDILTWMRIAVPPIDPRTSDQRMGSLSLPSTYIMHNFA